MWPDLWARRRFVPSREGLVIYVSSRKMFEELNRAIVQHRLQPCTGKDFRFEEARAT